MADIRISAAGASRLAEIAARRRGVAFKIDAGCCGGSGLILIDATFVGRDDVLLGEVEGAGVYVSRALRDSYESDSYHIDVQDGVAVSGFSIEIAYGFKFVMHRTVPTSPSESN